MMRQSTIALATIVALGFSANAFATVRAGSTTVSQAQVGATVPITYETRTGIQGASWQTTLTDASNIIVDASVRFQVFDADAGVPGFIDCDGNEYRVASATFVTCTQAGIYSIRRSTAGADLLTQNTVMRLLFNVENVVAANQTATVSFGTYCVAAQTTANDGCIAYFQTSDTLRDDTPDPALTSEPGTITLTAAPPATPPDLIFSTPGGTVDSGNSFSITPQNGQAGGSASYTCTPAGGVTLNDGDGDGTGNIATGGSAVNVTATCPAGPDGSVSCTHVAGAGSTAQPVTYTINCPAVPAPVLSSNPANGTTLTCNGSPGASTSTQATIQNTGNADMTGVSCNVAGAGFTLTTPPLATIPANSSSNAVVGCTVPASGTITGTLSCTTTAPAGGALSFPLSSTAAGGIPNLTPDIVPATSLWSKIGLIGLLAALGMLMVGFRRQQ